MKGILIKVKFITGYIFIIICLLSLSGTRVQGQIITTVAGSGTPPNNYGYTGDGGPATQATLHGDSRVNLDDSGNIYISDASNYVVREVNAKTGIITTVAGNGISGYSGDNGQATAAELGSPQGLCFDDSGNFYIADYGNHVIRKVITSTGIIITVAGNGTWNYGGDGGQATAAELSLPTGVTLDDSGNIIITDQWNYVIRKVSAKTGIITTIAGNHSQGFSGDGGQATDAALDLPSETVVDDSGNLYILDAQNQVIRKVTEATGIISEYAGTPQTAGYSGDNGPASAAEFNSPSGLQMDDSGNIYVADANNQVIRKITKSTGIITTVAGDNSLGAGFSGDGFQATLAQLNQPDGVSVDQCGNIYIADYNNNRVRKATVSSTDSLKAFASAPSICSGGTDTLTVIGGGSYAWSPSTGLNTTAGSIVIANPTVTTTYTVNGASTCMGAAIPATIVVTVGSAPALTVLQQPSTPVCKGQNVTLSISGGGLSFTWSPSTGLSATSGSSVIATPSDTTIYTVTGTSGGCSSTGMDTVNIVPALALLIKPQDTTICNGSSVTLFAPSSGSGYRWLPSATLSSAAADSVIATPTVQTTYTVNGTDSVGCAATGTDIIYVNVGFNKPIIADTDNLLTSTATQGNQWYRDDAAINGATGQSYTITDTGCFYDIATNIANGCSSISNTLCIDKLAGINLLKINPNLLSIYPNPTGGEIFVNISSSVVDVKDWNLQITDVLGRTVYTKLSLNYSNDIDLSDLPSGVYFITLIDKSERAVFPVVKQNY